MSHGHHHKKDHENHDQDKPKESEPAEQNGTKPPEKEAPREPLQVTISDIELENLKKESAEYKDKYLRLLAEGENTRKRMQKEKQEMILFSTQNVITEFLHPLDHLENALKFTQDGSDEVKHWGLGFQMILSQFKDVLANNGVTQVDSKGKVFDPHIHEAVETVETDEYPSGTIVEEFIRGYKMGDRVIRAARVKVAKAPSAANSENKEQNIKE